MRHVVQSIHVRRPPHEVFEVLADLPRYRRFFVGERLSSSMVRRNLIATLEALRHLCEWGPADGLGSRP